MAWILVLDRDAVERMELFRLLERMGHHATVTDDAATAAELLAAEPFDLALHVDGAGPRLEDSPVGVPVIRLQPPVDDQAMRAVIRAALERRQ